MGLTQQCQNRIQTVYSWHLLSQSWKINKERAEDIEARTIAVPRTEMARWQTIDGIYSKMKTEARTTEIAKAKLALTGICRESVRQQPKAC